MQVLVIGKISQAAIVAASAYKDQDSFQKVTGITKSRLIDDKLHRNTKVGHTLACWQSYLLTKLSVIVQAVSACHQQSFRL